MTHFTDLTRILFSSVFTNTLQWTLTYTSGIIYNHDESEQIAPIRFQTRSKSSARILVRVE